MINRQTFELDIPPSANHRLGVSAGKFYRNERFKRFMRLGRHALMVQGVKSYLPNVKLGCKILVVRDSLMRRDLDSYTKCTWDLLQEAGIINDDYQFWHLEIDRGPKERPGKLVMEIWELEDNKQMNTPSENDSKPLKEKRSH